MPHDRFYIDGPLEGTLPLKGDEFNHLFRVMRKKEGDTIELINGKNALALATIVSLHKKEASLSITHTEIKKPLLPPIKLIQAIPKTSHLEWILQKGTELGASHFYLYPSMHSEKKTFSKTQKNRFQHILISAMKQCGRLDLPSLEWTFPSLDENVYFGDLSPSALPLLSIASLPATLIIGPEKGFTKQEINHFRQQKAQGVRLSPHILRAETAAIAGLTLLANTK